MLLDLQYIVSQKYFQYKDLNCQPSSPSSPVPPFKYSRNEGAESMTIVYKFRSSRLDVDSCFIKIARPVNVLKQDSIAAAFLEIFQNL